MSVKEKLVELLTDNLPRIGDLPKCDNPLQYKSDEIVERIAAHLELNGVTVQEWISVDERLPEKDGRYLVAMKNGDNYHISTRRFKRIDPPIWWKCHSYGYWARYTGGVRYWMPLPEVPKGE